MVLKSLARFHSNSRLISTRSPVYSLINPLNLSHSLQTTLLETSHLTSAVEKNWIEQEFASLQSHELSIAQRLNSLSMLQMEECFDEFLHKKFGTFKRYSCEGTESIHPGLYTIFQEYHSPSPSSIVLTLSHRGKLSLLTSLLRYPLRLLFAKIQGKSSIPHELNTPNFYYSDDIPFNKAFSAERPELPGLKLILLHNSCHVELGGAVGMGKTRAKIDSGTPAMHVWVHGDAAVAGQGIAYEMTQMSQLHKFKVNGTLHIVENNQIGFTSGEASEMSSPYCTEVFKIIGAPILHINAKAVDDVVKAGLLAVRYRNKFKNDFVIDLVGYRKYGHNELDDPTITNPLMYKSIKKLGITVNEYAEKLIQENITTHEHITNLKEKFNRHLNEELEASKSLTIKSDISQFFYNNNFTDQWQNCSPIHSSVFPKTGVSLETLSQIAKQSVQIPDSITPHPIIKKTFKDRLFHLNQGKVDWALSEALAIGSLLQDGFNVRLSGEDVIRGTFSQRHIGVVCQDTEKVAFPLSTLLPGKLSAVNSSLSELGVLGFEYGYSLDSPKNLVIWESQYGDFANMAQAIIDNYICSGESKSSRQSGIVVLLPHGQEGQGAEHSSAQIERYLSMVNDPLSAQVNIEVVNSVFPSNYFHVLRRSVLRNFRRPLFITTPKSGLRNPLSYSNIKEFAETEKFKPVLQVEKGKGSKTLFICSGKVYLDLIARFENISLMVIEQLSPIPIEEIETGVNESGKKIVWVQEEPENFGCWRYLRDSLEKVGGRVEVVARRKSSVGADGSLEEFKDQTERILERVRGFGAS